MHLNSDFDNRIPLGIQDILKEWEAEAKKLWSNSPFTFKVSYLWNSKNSTLFVLGNKVGAMIGVNGKRVQKYKEKIKAMGIGFSDIKIHFQEAYVVPDIEVQKAPPLLSYALKYAYSGNTEIIMYEDGEEVDSFIASNYCLQTVEEFLQHLGYSSQGYLSDGDAMSVFSHSEK